MSLFATKTIDQIEREQLGTGERALKRVIGPTQLVMLGLIGEYVGRMFLTVNQRPQAVVREIVRTPS